MALDHPIDTDDGAVPAAVRRFIRHRLLELAGFVLFATDVAAGLALATWSPSDPSFNRAIDGDPANLLGYPGAVIADELMQLLGLDPRRLDIPGRQRLAIDYGTAIEEIIA